MTRVSVLAGATALAGLALVGCTAQEATDAVLRRTAQTVVTPVLDTYMSPAEASVATFCLLDAATSDDLRVLSRDVGVEAGTATVQNVFAIAERPAAQSCLLRAGVPALPL